MKYLKSYNESIYNDNRSDAKYKVGDTVVDNRELINCTLLKIVHISSEYNSLEMPIYDCQALNDPDYQPEFYEDQIRLATPEEINVSKYNL